MPKVNVKDKRKQQLIQATIDSIAKRGLTETTITHISNGAGMSRGIINFYFTSKEMMMRDTLQTLMDEYDAVWTEAVAKHAGDAKAELLALVDAHFDRKLCQPKRLNVLSAFWGHAATHAAYRTILDASDAKLLAAIGGAWEQLRPNGYNAQHFARQLHAMIRGLWLSFLMAPNTAREELAAECKAFVEQHLQPLHVVAAQPVDTTPAAAPKLLNRRAKPVEKQMDIEDLFAPRLQA